MGLNQTFQLVARLSLVLITICFGFLLVFPLCPECFKNLAPMNGPPAEDGSGRRQIVIKIDSSWGSTTDAKIWNGTVDARQDWNTRTDGNNNTTGYFLKLDQTSPTPDILIKKGATSSGCAELDVSGSPKVYYVAGKHNEL